MKNGTENFNPRWTYVRGLSLISEERLLLKRLFLQKNKITLDNVYTIPNQANPIFYWLKNQHPVVSKYERKIKNIVGDINTKTIFVIHKPGDNLRPHIDKENDEKHMRVCLLNFPIMLPCTVPTDWYEDVEKVSERWFKEDKSKIIDQTYYDKGDTVLLNTKFIHGANNNSRHWRIFLQITFEETYENVLNKVKDLL